VLLGDAAGGEVGDHGGVVGGGDDEGRAAGGADGGGQEAGEGEVGAEEAMQRREGWLARHVSRQPRHGRRSGGFRGRNRQRAHHVTMHRQPAEE